MNHENNEEETECKSHDESSPSDQKQPSESTPESTVPAPRRKNVIVCWDFDWSLVNENTDHYVHQKLYGKVEYARLLPILHQKAVKSGVAGATVHTNFMDKYSWPQLFKDFNLNPKSFASALSDLPIFKENLKILETINQHSDQNNNGEQSFNINQYIISNANQVLVDVVLNANGFRGTVFKNDQIFTNPGWYDPETRVLRVQRYHNVLLEGEVMNPHDCDLCAANLCKGKVLREEVFPRYQKRQFLQRFANQVVYIGDGGNDFCAVRSLKKGDYAFVRKFDVCKGLEAKVEENKANLKCNILKWRNGKELLENFKKVIPELEF